MLIPIQDTQHFFDYISKIVDGEYQFKYLTSVLAGIFEGVLEPGSKSYVHEENGGWLIFLEVQGHLYIYGNNYSDVHLSYFMQRIDLQQRRGWEIMGTMDLVYVLLKRSDIIDFTVIKDRCFYELTVYEADLVDDGIEPAVPADLNVLVVMFQHYYEEEYQGQRNKAAGDLSPRIARMILKGSLYVAKIHHEIAGFCSIIDPDIGILFTEEAHRGQGWGYRLLGFCSSILFKKNGLAYVMTDMHNQASNKICQKIGYRSIYEHTNLKI